jgi:multisubunit Na+/H+ antiporter MnhE subunit
VLAAQTALQAAIAADPGVAAAQTALANDQALLSAAKNQLETDEAPVETAEAALKAAINADPGIIAAQTTLANDQAALVTANTLFQNDLATYVADLKAGI